MNWLASVSMAPVDEEWHKEPVRLSFGAEKWVRINGEPWRAAKEVTVANEGVNDISIKSAPNDPMERTGKVRIDLTAPVIRLNSEPVLDQEGGVYIAAPDTEFVLEATDALSGVATLEVAVDNGEFKTYTGPFRLSAGHHLLKSRATDRAGNRSTLMTGSALSGGSTSAAQLEIQ